jgi:betaine-homocysteine S-methyltransferase
MSKKRGILERLANGVVLGDGGYVLELERRGYVQAGPFTPEATIEFPEAVRQLHLEFKRAGAEVLQALTFYGSSDKLAAAMCVSEAEDINRAAVRIARAAAGNDTLVAGGLTLTPGFRPGNAASAMRARQLMCEQVLWQEDVDFIIGETFIYLEEAVIALDVIRASGLPAMITMNIGQAGSADGVSVEECARRLAGQGADIVGVNCAFDPEALLPVAERMRGETDAFIACQPVGYRTAEGSITLVDHPGFPLALESGQLTRFELAAFARRASDAGINYIGGCCGVAAHHIRSMAEALGRCPPASLKSPDLSCHVIPSVARKASDEYWQSLLREEMYLKAGGSA